MPPTIRPATPADLDRVLDLDEALEREDPSPEPFQREATARVLSQLVAEPALGRLFVAETGGDVVGYLLMTFGFSLQYLGRDVLVDSFYIVPEHRGRGLGSAMLARAEAEARALGIQAMHLEVSPELPAARLYRRTGFVAHERTFMTRWLDGIPGLASAR